MTALSLTGIPLFAGFVSKWKIAQAAFGVGTALSFGAAAVLLYSALMTGIYMMTVVFRAWFPERGTDAGASGEVREAGWMMLVPLVVFALIIAGFGFGSAPFTEYFEQIAGGVI